MPLLQMDIWMWAVSASKSKKCPIFWLRDLPSSLVRQLLYRNNSYRKKSIFLHLKCMAFARIPSCSIPIIRIITNGIQDTPPESISPITMLSKNSLLHGLEAVNWWNGIIFILDLFTGLVVIFHPWLLFLFYIKTYGIHLDPIPSQ